MHPEAVTSSIMAAAHAANLNLRLSLPTSVRLPTFQPDLETSRGA